MSHARFQKQLRERARREKAAAKRERREARHGPDASEGHSQQLSSEPEILAQLAALHDRFGQGAIDFEEFERRKQELTGLLDG